MLRDVRVGGTLRRVSGGLILEEYPEGHQPNAILNGWIFALFGLYDFMLLSDAPDGEITSSWRASLDTLVELSHRYDRGYWSNYDLRGHIASPFYHDLHIAQLKALELVVDPASQLSLRRVRLRFQSQRARRAKRAKAVAVKVWQKLKEPPPVVFS